MLQWFSWPFRTLVLPKKQGPVQYFKGRSPPRPKQTGREYSLCSLVMSRGPIQSSPSKGRGTSFHRVPGLPEREARHLRVGNRPPRSGHFSPSPYHRSSMDLKSFKREVVPCREDPVG